MRFRAFISYSHQDETWAKWLQKSLEGYRVPSRLAGTDGEHGPVPADLRPIFRDREDLSSASDLTQSIRNEIEASENLIVICSPASAQSKWVNEEIRHFKSLGRSHKIFALVVDGVPGSEKPDEDCFPAALKERSDGGAKEPLAADIRPYADGKTLSKLKLIAGILGIRLDELRRRDRQRRKRKLVISAVFAFITLALAVWLAMTAITSQKEAQMQRAGTEDLLSFMLGDLQSLEPIVGLEVIDQSDEEVIAYMQNAGFDQMSDLQLNESALKWREEGQISHERGELDFAMERFQRSRAALIELYQRDSRLSDRLFELGQAEFWVGYVHMDKSELNEAQASFTRYGAITRRLVNADPDNAEMVMELAQTLINLSALEHMRQDLDHERALRLRQTALQYTQIALVLDPENRYYKQELSTIMAFVADAWLETCNLGKAFQFRQQNVGISRQLLEELPEDTDRKLKLAYALSGLAIVQSNISLAGPALESLRESKKWLAELLDLEPDNQLLLWDRILREQRIAWLQGLAGETAAAYSTTRLLAEQLSLSTIEGDYLMAVDQAQIDINVSVLAHAMGRGAEARTRIELAIDQLVLLVEEQPENRFSRNQLGRAVFEQWAQSNQFPTKEVRGLLGGFLSPEEPVTRCDDASLAAKLAVMDSNTSLAAGYVDSLLSKGFYEPEFISFCRAHKLCE